MKKFFQTAISILIMVMVVSINTASAEKRHILIEMGESGQILSFLMMTPEEMTAEDADKKRLSEIRRKSYIDDNKTNAYEMAESGMLIEFPEHMIGVDSASIAKMENP